MSYELMMYHTDTGNKTVLVGPDGRKLMPVLLIEGSGLTVRKVPLTERRLMHPALEGKNRRSMSGVIKQYRGIGRRLGMTKAAKSFLAEATKAA